MLRRPVRMLNIADFGVAPWITKFNPANAGNAIPLIPIPRLGPRAARISLAPRPSFITPMSNMCLKFPPSPLTILRKSGRVDWRFRTSVAFNTCSMVESPPFYISFAPICRSTLLNARGILANEADPPDIPPFNFPGEASCAVFCRVISPRALTNVHSS